MFVIKRASIALVIVLSPWAAAVDRTWVGATGSWNVDSNWDPVGVPGASDIAIIENGNISVDIDVTIAGLDLRSGTVDASQAMEVTEFSWSGGTLTGAGLFTVPSGGSLIVPTGTSIVQLTTKTLRLEGNAVLEDGQLRLRDSAVIDNLGVFDFQSDVSITIFGGANMFNNEGTLRKSGGVGVSRIFPGVTLNNTGEVEVLSGTLDLSGGGGGTGTMDGAAGSTLRFSSSMTLDGDLSSEGDVEFAAGTRLVNGGYDVSGQTVFASGTTTFALKPTEIHFDSVAGELNFAFTDEMVLGTLSMDGGTWDAAGPIQVADFIWSGGTLTGAGLFTIPSGGILTIPTGTSIVQLRAKTLRFEGDTNLEDGQLRMRDSAVVDNLGVFDFQSDASISVFSGTNAFNNEGTLRKSGGVGVSRIFPGITLNNTGEVEVLSGTLDFSGGGGGTGTMNGAAGSTLRFSSSMTLDGDLSSEGDVEFASGTNTIGGDYDVSGMTVFESGTTTFSSKPTEIHFDTVAGVLNFPFTEEMILGTLSMAGGTWNAAGPLTLADFTWTGGTLAGEGLFRIAAGGSLRLPIGASIAQLKDKTLRLEGDTVLEDGQLRMQGSAVVENFGVFDFQDDASLTVFSGTHVFNNMGTVRKSGGAGTSSVHPAIAFNNTGDVEVLSGTLRIRGDVTQDDGNIRVIDSILSFDKPLKIDGGRLEGTGTVVADLSNSSVISPGASAGTLTIDGSYAQSILGTLEVELGGLSAGDQHDVLSIAGAAMFAGGIEVKLLGDFVPVQYDSFQIATTGARSGEFQAAGFPMPGELGWRVVYDDNRVTLEVSNTVPVFGVGSSLLAGPEQTELSRDLSASDADSPAQILSYSLVEGPVGAVINPTTGQFTWTPLETQGPETATVIVKVVDNGVPSLSQTLSFEVRAEEFNLAPTLDLPASISVDELEAVDFQISAMDSDVPANTLAYALVSGPEGLTVNPTSGAIVWTPTEQQGPGDHVVTVRVTDSNPVATNEKALSTEGSFTIRVNEINSPPSVTPPGSLSTDEMTLFETTITVVDGDLPANGFTFEVVGGPDGLTVDTNGKVSWTPAEDQAPEVHPVSIRVTDNGVPAESIDVGFNITANEVNRAPVLGEIGIKLVHPDALVVLTASATDEDLPENELSYSIVSGPSGATIDSTSGQFEWFAPKESEGIIEEVKIRVSDNGDPAMSDEVTFTIDVGESLKITAIDLTNGIFKVTWNAIAGLSYVFESNDELDAPEWEPVGDPITADSNSASASDSISPVSRFYRVRQLPP
ncbi:putative Ig domain-containing protein [Haloferula sp.]|uniref:putative Ig domain-containing protein n=1 Tax=Haloferula sp. TaxID=2497595 RepID=UPI003C76234F